MEEKDRPGEDQLSDFAVRFIQDAGRESLSYYGKGRPDIRFDEALVTEIELRLTEYFHDRIHAHFPEHRIFLNKQEDEGYTHEKERYLWVFDPLDGAANFQGGIPIWGLSLALLENAWPVFGLFYMPATGDMFHARAGAGAHWKQMPIGVRDPHGIDDESVLFTYSRFHSHYQITFPGKIRSLGSTAAHLCYVAGGQGQAAIIARETYKDLAAVRVIVEAAGLRIYRLDGEEFFLNAYLDGADIDQPLVVVSPENKDRVIGSLKRMP